MTSLPNRSQIRHSSAVRAEVGSGNEPTVGTKFQERFRDTKEKIRVIHGWVVGAHQDAASVQWARDRAAGDVVLDDCHRSLCLRSPLCADVGGLGSATLRELPGVGR